MMYSTTTPLVYNPTMQQNAFDKEVPAPPSPKKKVVIKKAVTKTRRVPRSSLGSGEDGAYLGYFGGGQV